MGDAEARFVAVLAAVERLDRHIGVAVADVLVTVAWPLARFFMRFEQLAEAEHVAVEVEDRLGVERVERQMRDARHARFGGTGAEAEALLRERDRVALRIVDAHGAVLQVAVLGHDRAAWIARAIAGDDRVDVVDRNSEMMQALLHARLAQRGALAEQGEIEAAVGERHVAVSAAAELRKAEMAAIEAGEGGRIGAEQREITEARHESLLLIQV